MFSTVLKKSQDDFNYKKSALKIFIFRADFLLYMFVLVIFLMANFIGYLFRYMLIFEHKHKQNSNHQ